MEYLCLVHRNFVLLAVHFFPYGYAQNWSVEDFALFDLVEELENKNFYADIFQVNQDASTAEIKRAYRKLSLVYHPDKNKDPNAAEKFRQLAAVYEVLKDENSRKKYDEVLEFGLPNWKQPIFYYRTVRKMPWWETALLLLIIFTVGQYLMLWGSYAEQMLTVQEDIDKLKKKEKKYRKQNIDVEDLILDLKEKRVEKPQLTHLLLCSLIRTIIVGVTKLPLFCAWCIEVFRKRNAPEEEEEDEHVVQSDSCKLKKRIQAKFVEPLHCDLATDLKPVSTSTLSGEVVSKDEDSHIQKTREWTVEETAHLIRLTTSKYPTGTPNRWEKIGSVLRRKPEDITYMVGKLKHMDQEEYQKLTTLANSFQWSTHDDTTKRESHSLCETNEESRCFEEQWTQAQQKLFEAALQQFPKGTPERWEKISRYVPGKSKEECLLRFKFLAEMIRSRKEQPKQ